MQVGDLFATPLTTSHYVELVNPLWTTHRLQARVVDVHDETPTTRTLTLKPGRGWHRHRAGQYVRVGVTVGGMRQTRTFSISSSPDRADGRITITVKATEGGRVTPFLAREVPVGTFLPLGQPQGDFVLPWAVPLQPLFLTAGSGVTPVMSMLRTYDLEGTVPDACHLHFAPTGAESIFHGELTALAEAHPRYRYLPVFTREEGPGHGVHLSRELLDEHCPDWERRDVWVCGPPALVARAELLCSDAGRTRHLHVERFQAPLGDPLPGAAGGTVRFAASGREVVADGHTNLLWVAEDAGLNPPHGCRMGICHSCDCTLVRGKVRDLRTGRLVGEPGGRIQPCVSAAAGDVELGL